MISIVIPVYRNRDTLVELHRRIVAAVQVTGRRVEIVFVNDACPDGSHHPLQAIAAADPQVVRVVTHEARRGQHEALLTGLHTARGEVVVTMDADLQDPPEAIPDLVAGLGDGYGAVYAGRRGQYESRGRLATSWFFKRTLSAITGMPPDAGSFVAMSRVLVERLLTRAGTRPYLTGAIACSGFPVTSIPVTRAVRAGGESAYSGWMRLQMAARALAQAVQWRWAARRAAVSDLEGRAATTARPWPLAVFAAAVFGAATVYTLAYGDVGWDGAWVLQVIARMNAGDVLYRDVFAGVTPLAFSLGSAVMAVTGVELVVLRALTILTVTGSYVLTAHLARRLTGTTTYDAPLALAALVVSVPANVPFYQPLANVWLLAAVAAALAGVDRDRRALFAVAGGCAALSFLAKQTTGAFAFGAALTLMLLMAGGRHSSMRRDALALFLASFSVVIVVGLAPIVWSGGAAMFLDYGFLNKSRYVQVGGVPYWSELAAFLQRIGAGNNGVLQTVRDSAVLVPALLLPALAVGAIRARDRRAAVCVAVLAAAELASLYPRADIDHIVPATPGMLVVIAFGWHMLPARRVWRTAGTAAVAVVMAGAALRVSSGVWALIDPARTWSALPHLQYTRLTRDREAALQRAAMELRSAAPDGELFLLVPDAGLLYLISGVRNVTPFDYPLVTAFGRAGEESLARAVEQSALPRLCVRLMSGTLAPERLQGAVESSLIPAADLGPCTLYEARR